VLDPCEPFLLSGGDDLAVDDQCRRRIMVERGNAKNRGNIVAPSTMVIQIMSSTSDTSNNAIIC